jgi:hypothetical protein
MKNILLVFLFFPILVFSQTEKSQKESYRQSQNNSLPTIIPNRTPEVQQKFDFRENNRPNNTPIYQPKNPSYYYANPYYYNRWSMWGAPSSYLYYDDFYYRNRWGYKSPARIYYQNDGKRDTVVSKKNKIRMGVNMSTKNEVGGFITVGRETYFKASFNKTFYHNESTFYSNITMDVVQQWVRNNPTQNYRLNDIKDGWNLYLGIGKEFGNFGANVSLGIGYEKDLYQYFDGTYILSNNGKYSFSNFVNNYTTLSFGLTHDFKFLSLSADYDPFRKDLYFGLGINF